MVLGPRSRAVRPAFVAALLCLASTGGATAQDGVPVAPELAWRSIGPAVAGGRITDLEIVPGEAAQIYVGAASGGVWKSLNHGTTWEPVFDEAANLSIGDIALAPSDPLEVWVGTGEANNRNSSPWGQGVYRSRDGGKTWTLVGLEETRHVGRIVIHPSDPEVVWVAALGHLFGSNEERGVFKTTDGGRTWRKVLYIDEHTGVVDLALNPADPQTLYAAAYQRQRRAWGFIGGGPGSGIFKSTDGGETWRELTNGLPEGDKGRIGLAVWNRDPNLVMAVVEAEDGGIFRSEDRGETWRKTNSLNQRPMYYSQLRIDPNTDQRIYLVAGNLHRSEDGGETFASLPMEVEYNTGVHVDHHDMWIDPADSRHMILGNDGGLYATWDMGDNWTFIANLPIQQFYDVDLDMAEPYFVYGGLQDNNSYRGPSRTRRYQGILNRDWQVVDYGDGMYAETDWADPSIAYVSSQGGAILRLDVATGDRKDVQPFPHDTAETYRFEWKSPILVSPHDHDRVYLGGNRLFISDDRGITWRESVDLSRQLERDSLPIMGMLTDSTTLSRHDGVSSYGEITAISESPVTPGVLWAGLDDGNLQVSRDDGVTWTEVSDNLPGLPHRMYVSWVEASHAAAGRAFLSVDGHWDDDYAPYLFVTDDFGATWRTIAAGLESATVNVIREHPTNPDLLFVGAEDGAFASTDRGRTWGLLGKGLPRVPVDDLEIHPRDDDLVAGTHGRGIWILDDISPLSQRTETASAAVQLVSPRPATIFQYKNDVPSQGQGIYRADNPPFGAWLHYWLPEPTDEVEIRISDADGELIRSIDGSGARGLNRVVWDLRHEPLPHDTARFDVPQLDVGPRGPFVLPGTFAVELSALGANQTAELEVRPDPLLDITPDERMARYVFTLELYELQKTGYARGVVAYDLDRGTNRALDSLFAGEDLSAEDSLVADSLAAELASVAGTWRSRNNDVRGWWRGLIGKFDGGPSTIGSLTGPSDAQMRRLAVTKDQYEEAEARLDEALRDTLPRLNALLSRYGVDPIADPPPA